MFKKNTTRLLLDILWLLSPSLLWSVVFHDIALCVDPFLMQLLERRLSSRSIWLIRLAWMLAFFVAVLEVWNIAPQSYSFYLREALPYSPPSVLFCIGAALVVLLGFAAYRGINFLSRSRSYLLFTVGVALLMLKLVFQQVGMTDPIHAKSQAAKVAFMGYKLMSGDRAERIEGTPERTFNSYIRAQEQLPKKVILMVIESWGERPDELRKISAEMQSEKLQVLKAGFATYQGGTLNGEFRELCSHYVPPDSSIDAMTDSECVPGKLGQMGYDVVGMHGYDKAFYARATFWRRFGISRELFKDSLHDLRRCAGAFDGVCDAAIIRRGVELLNSDTNKRFVYVLTLSSHEPLGLRAFDEPKAPFFQDIPVLHPTQIVTRHAISDLIVELGRTRDKSCTLAYVVGDHQPPSGAARHDLFVENQVPFIAFKANCGGPRT